MSNLTFLTIEQCLGEKKLELFKKRGANAVATDFSIILGLDTDSWRNTSCYFTKSQYRKPGTVCIVQDGEFSWYQFRTLE